MRKRSPTHLSPELRLFLRLGSIIVLILWIGLSQWLKPSEEIFSPQISSSSQSNQSINYQDVLVVKVIDGDTFEIQNGQRVRLIGIDTPESRKNSKAMRDSERSKTDIETILKMGKKAKDVLSGLIAGKNVRMEFDVGKKDKYNRLLAYVYVNDATQKKIFVNERMIEMGYASPMSIPPNVKYASLFKKTFDEARLAKRGLWKDTDIASE